MHRAARLLIPRCHHRQPRRSRIRDPCAPPRSSFLRLPVLLVLPSKRQAFCIIRCCYGGPPARVNGRLFHETNAFGGDAKELNEVYSEEEITAGAHGSAVGRSLYGIVRIPGSDSITRIERVSDIACPRDHLSMHDSRLGQIPGADAIEKIKKDMPNLAHCRDSEAQLEQVLCSDSSARMEEDLFSVPEARLRKSYSIDRTEEYTPDFTHDRALSEGRLEQMPCSDAIDRIKNQRSQVLCSMPDPRLQQMACSDTLHEVEQKLDCDGSTLPLADVSFLSFLLNEHGWSPKAEDMLQKFSSQITPELVNTIINELKDAKVAMAFLEWAGKQQNYEHEEGTFTKVIGRLGKNMDFAAAWNVLEFMRHHGLHVDYAFSIFIHRLKSAKLVDGVIKAIDSIGQLDVIPTVPLYTSALQLILKDNRLDEAWRIYNKMRELGLNPDVKLYGLLISTFGRAGKINDAISLFEEMRRHGVSPDTITYVGLIRAFAIAGDFGGGKMICAEMIHNNCLPKTLSRFELGCALHGMKSMEQIEGLLNDIEMKGHVISVFTYNNILQYLLDKRMLPEAIKVFGRFSGYPHLPTGDSSDRPRPNIDSYSLIIRALCQNGLLKDAVHFYREMAISGLKAGTEICDFLLHYLSDAGLLYDAVELSKYIMKQKLVVSIETQRTFFKSLHAAGDLPNALKIFDSMKWRGCIRQTSSFHELIGV